MIDKKDTECIFKFVGIIGCGVVFSLAGISLFVSVLIHGITEVYEVISQKRMNKFIDEFNKNIQRIDENNINKNFLKTEEFYDFFFVETLNCVMKERWDDKITFFSKLLVDSIVNSKLNYNMDYVKALSELSYEQIVILKEMHNQQKDLPYDGKEELNKCG